MTEFKQTSGSKRHVHAQSTLDLRLLQTTDLHAHVLAFDYLADRPADKNGLSRLAHLIRAARAECRNSLLLDTGDVLQGNPLGDVYARHMTSQQDQPHPVIAVMNSLGYDAATLGNHDFNFGLEFLERALHAAKFDMVCANAALQLGTRPYDDRTLLQPWTILKRQMPDREGILHDLRVGVIGLLPPQIDIWDRQHLEGRLHTRDMVETARAYLPLVRAAGADLVVILSHSGIAPKDVGHRMENAALSLAALPGVDAILCGHQHQLFPGPAFDGIKGVDIESGALHGTPAVMAGFWGSHLGIIDLVLTRDARGWQVSGHAVQLRQASPYPGQSEADSGANPDTDDSTMQELVRGAHARTRARLNRPVGHVSKPLHSYFALVADDSSVQFVAAAQHDQIADWLQDRPEGKLPLLSAVSPFKTGGIEGPDHFTHVPAGRLKYRNLADLYQFPNTLCAVQVTGAALSEWLEHAAGQFNRIVPGQHGQMLRDPAFASYNFDVICGLRYVIDPTQPPRYAPDGQLLNPNARRVRDITYRAEPVLPDQRFIVATNSYRAGGAFAASVAMQDVALPARVQIHEVLATYVSRHASITPDTKPVWRFASIPETSVLFDSAPAAADFLPDQQDIRIETAGHSHGGFVRFRLFL